MGVGFPGRLGVEWERCLGSFCRLHLHFTESSCPDCSPAFSPHTIAWAGLERDGPPVTGTAVVLRPDQGSTQSRLVTARGACYSGSRARRLPDNKRAASCHSYIRKICASVDGRCHLWGPVSTKGQGDGGTTHISKNWNVVGSNQAAQKYAWKSHACRGQEGTSTDTALLRCICGTRLKQPSSWRLPSCRTGAANYRPVTQTRIQQRPVFQSAVSLNLV